MMCPKVAEYIHVLIKLNYIKLQKGILGDKKTKYFNGDIACFYEVQVWPTATFRIIILPQYKDANARLCVLRASLGLQMRNISVNNKNRAIRTCHSLGAREVKV